MGCSIGQEEKCKQFGCQWMKSYGEPCEKGGDFAFVTLNPKKQKIMHVWLDKNGIYFTSAKISPIKNRKLKYMGFTYDKGYPIKLENGRVLKEAGSKRKTTATKSNTARQSREKVPKGIVTSRHKT